MPRRRSRRARRVSPSENRIAVLAALFVTCGAWLLSRGLLHWLPVAFALSLSVGLLLHWWRAATRRQALLANTLDTLTPTQFEERIALLLRDLGWTDVQRVGQAGDHGVDVRGVYGGVAHIVQCKHYSSSGNAVGEGAIRDLAGALTHEAAERAILVCSTTFTTPAQQWAAGKPIALWDREMLGRQIAFAQAQRSPEDTRTATRRAWMRRVSVLAMLNGAALLLTTFAPPLALPNVRVAAFTTPARPIARTLPTRTIPTPSVAPAHTAAPTAAPLRAQVSTEGNVRAAPSKQGKVVGLIRVGEQVTLHGRSADGAWLQISITQGINGWAHRSLLLVEDVVMKQLTVTP